MRKKFKVISLVTVVVAGLVLFESSQVGAQTQPPTDSTRIITCSAPSTETLRLLFDQTSGELVQVFWCDTNDSSCGIFPNDWTEIIPAYTYICPDGSTPDPMTGLLSKCRLIQNTSLLYFCEGALGGCLGGKCFPKP
jgi:hypothetical protein